MNPRLSSENQALPLASPSDNSARLLESLAGVLLGTAVGDALGLPMEGLSARRQQQLFPGPLRHRLIGPWGMVSDDTEHTFLTAQALLAAGPDEEKFQHELARRLRWWLAAAPAAVGWATLRAILKLWLGFPPSRSGVDSAGNGPAMRSALLGVYFCGSEAKRRAFVRRSVQLTHRDPRAATAALAVAETAAWMTAGEDDAESLFPVLRELDHGTEWQDLLLHLEFAAKQNETVQAFAQSIGAVHAVSGYAFRTVPVAIYAALRHRDDFAEALSSAIRCGGDTDSVGAITGALVAAHLGAGLIPPGWRQGLVDYPISLRLLQTAATELHKKSFAGSSAGPLRFPWFGFYPRNLIFFLAVLWHGLRRLLPPYGMGKVHQ